MIAFRRRIIFLSTGLSVSSVAFLCALCVKFRKSVFKYFNSEATEKTYVPSDQEARYSSCSGVSLSICTPIDSSFNLAICLSIASGTT